MSWRQRRRSTITERPPLSSVQMTEDSLQGEMEKLEIFKRKAMESRLIRDTFKFSDTLISLIDFCGGISTVFKSNWINANRKAWLYIQSEFNAWLLLMIYHKQEADKSWAYVFYRYMVNGDWRHRNILTRTSVVTYAQLISSFFDFIPKELFFDAQELYEFFETHKEDPYSSTVGLTPNKNVLKECLEIKEEILQNIADNFGHLSDENDQPLHLRTSYKAIFFDLIKKLAKLSMLRPDRALHYLQLYMGKLRCLKKIPVGTLVLVQIEDDESFASKQGETLLQRREGKRWVYGRIAGPITGNTVSVYLNPAEKSRHIFTLNYILPLMDSVLLKYFSRSSPDELEKCVELESDTVLLEYMSFCKMKSREFLYTNNSKKCNKSALQEIKKDILANLNVSIFKSAGTIEEIASNKPTRAPGSIKGTRTKPRAASMAFSTPPPVPPRRKDLTAADDTFRRNSGGSEGLEKVQPHPLHRANQPQNNNDEIKSPLPPIPPRNLPSKLDTQSASSNNNIINDVNNQQNININSSGGVNNISSNVSSDVSSDDNNEKKKPRSHSKKKQKKKESEEVMEVILLAKKNQCNFRHLETLKKILHLLNDIPESFYEPVATKFKDLVSELESNQKTKPFSTFYPTLEKRMKELNEFDPVIAMRSEIKQIRGVCEMAIEEINIQKMKFIKESKTDLLNRWNAIISSKVLAFLSKLGYQNIENIKKYMIEKPNQDLLLIIKKNIVILQRLVTSFNSVNDILRVKDLIKNICQIIYPINEYYCLDIKYFLSWMLNIPSSSFSRTTARECASKIDDQTLETVNDLLETRSQLKMLQKHEDENEKLKITSSEYLKSIKSSSILPVSWMVLSEFSRLETDCRTILELWLSSSYKLENSRSPLELAVIKGDTKHIEALIKSGQHHINEVDENGWSVLHLACSFCFSSSHLDVSKFLIEAFPEINTSLANNLGNSPFHYFVRLPISASEMPLYIQIIKQFLVSNTALPHLPNAQGETPLHCAVLGSNITAVRELLLNSGDPNAPNLAGETCLHLAVQNQDLQMTQLLLQHGASNTAKNAKGEDAFDIAAKLNYIDIAECLLREGTNEERLLEAEKRKAARIKCLSSLSKIPSLSSFSSLDELYAHDNLPSSHRQSPPIRDDDINNNNNINTNNNNINHSNSSSNINNNNIVSNNNNNHINNLNLIVSKSCHNLSNSADATPLSPPQARASPPVNRSSPKSEEEDAKTRKKFFPFKTRRKTQSNSTSANSPNSPIASLFQPHLSSQDIKLLVESETSQSSSSSYDSQARGKLASTVNRRDSLLTPISKPTPNSPSPTLTAAHNTSSDRSSEINHRPPINNSSMKKTNSVNSGLPPAISIPLQNIGSSNNNSSSSSNNNINSVASPRIEQLDYFQQFLASHNSPTTAVSTISDVASDREVSEIDENYVDDSGQDYFNQFFTNSSNSITPSSSSSSLSTLDNNNNGPKQYRIAKWAKTVDEEGELGFEVGDVITVISSHSSGWWVGTIDNQTCGIFPVNYTLPLPFGEEEE